MQAEKVNLNEFCFPIEERPIEIPKTIIGKDLAPTAGIMEVPANDRYKAIVRGDTGELISVVSKNYQTVKNAALIETFLSEIGKVGEKWELEPSHSWVTNSRMRLQVKFPNIIIPDGDTSIALSVFLNNSYNRTEGIRAVWGGLRAVCTNGMVFGNVLGKFYARHIKKFEMGDMQTAFGKTMEKLPALQHRINHLKEAEVSLGFLETLEKEIGIKAMDALFGVKEIRIEDMAPDETLWGVYNKVTEHISHRIPQVQQERYQEAVSKVFEL